MKTTDKKTDAQAQPHLISVLDDARRSIASAPTGWQAVVVVLVTVDGNFAIHSRESTDTAQVLRAAVEASL